LIAVQKEFNFMSLNIYQAEKTLAIPGKKINIADDPVSVTLFFPD